MDDGDEGLRPVIGARGFLHRRHDLKESPVSRNLVFSVFCIDKGAEEKCWSDRYQTCLAGEVCSEATDVLKGCGTSHPKSRPMSAGVSPTVRAWSLPVAMAPNTLAAFGAADGFSDAIMNKKVLTNSMARLNKTVARVGRSATTA